jgi:hypothetical protein
MEGSHGSNSNGLAPRRRLRRLAPGLRRVRGRAEKGRRDPPESVYRANDDPRNLLVTHGFATTAEAEAFLGGADLRDAMQEAGVQGQSRIEIYQDM